jgi:hypothetical protein
MAGINPSTLFGNWNSVNDLRERIVGVYQNTLAAAFELIVVNEPNDCVREFLSSPREEGLV